MGKYSIFSAKSFYSSPLRLFCVTIDFPLLQFSRGLACNGICPFKIAYGEGQIPSRLNLLVLTVFAA